MSKPSFLQEHTSGKSERISLKQPPAFFGFRCLVFDGFCCNEMCPAIWGRLTINSKYHQFKIPEIGVTYPEYYLIPEAMCIT